MLTQPPRPPLFPYTTLFRSDTAENLASNPGGATDTDRTTTSAGRTPVNRRCNPSTSLSRLTSTCATWPDAWRSEEHTSELQSHHDLVCRLLLEKKKQPTQTK